VTLTDRKAREIAHEVIAATAMDDNTGISAALLAIEDTHTLQLVGAQLTILAAGLVRAAAAANDLPLTQLLAVWRSLDPELPDPGDENA